MKELSRDSSVKNSWQFLYFSVEMWWNHFFYYYFGILQLSKSDLSNLSVKNFQRIHLLVANSELGSGKFWSQAWALVLFNCSNSSSDTYVIHTCMQTGHVFFVVCVLSRGDHILQITHFSLPMKCMLYKTYFCYVLFVSIIMNRIL